MENEKDKFTNSRENYSRNNKFRSSRRQVAYTDNRKSTRKSFKSSNEAELPIRIHGKEHHRYTSSHKNNQYYSMYGNDSHKMKNNSEGGYEFQNDIKPQGRFHKKTFGRNNFHRQNCSAIDSNRPNRTFRERTADYDPHAKYNVQKVLRYKEQNFDPDAPIRLNRYLANAGVCSRREADQFIADGLVTVNGEAVTELGHKVLRTDNVTFKGNALNLEDKVYILLNKPKDCVTTADDPEGRKTVMDIVKGACPERIYPVGRLDRNTTGVLLLTNDGEIAAKMTHPQFMKKKIYHVHCNKQVSFADMQKILEGITLEDGEIHADRIEYASEIDHKQVGIEIHSGKNRIVRRIFESLGYRVVKLDRVYFAGLTKKNLRRGHWRFLEEAEVNMLRMGAYE